MTMTLTRPDTTTRQGDFMASITAPFTCGHRNYGNDEFPASVFYDCPTCSKFYCDNCNYDTHRCHFCGDSLNHEYGGVHDECIPTDS